jgi:hypothetical protein
LGKVIPPAGPKVDDFIPESMWGVDVECLSARRCRIGGRAGELGTSRVFLIMRSDVFVLRLRLLGLRFMPGIFGLMKDGEVGSDTSEVETDPTNGGWIDNPFMFLGRLGEGEVIGRSLFEVSTTVRLDIVDGRPPKLAPGKDDRGNKLIGESGEEEGDGSERGDESVVDKVVVGEESADSEVCVDVLS